MRTQQHLLFFLVLLSSVFQNVSGQEDSTLQKSLTIGFIQDRIPTTLDIYQVKRIEITLKKKSITLLPSISYKEIQERKGIQFGGDFYKKSKWGYYHLGYHQSSSDNYPKHISTLALFFKMGTHMEVNVGARHIIYQDFQKLTFFTIGGTYYMKSWMVTYKSMLPSTGKISHTFSCRYYWNSSKDHVTLNFFTGSEDRTFANAISKPVDSKGANITTSKYVSKDLQLNLGVSRTYVKNEDVTSGFLSFTLGARINM